MFTIKVKTINKNPDGIKNLIKRAQEISKKRVAVGFPRGRLNSPHYEGDGNKPGPSIIDVAIINNFGLGVPRRDFMTPATEKWKEFCEETANAFKEDIISGKINIDDVLNVMGQKGADIISDEIIALKEPPNSPVTIERKKSSNPLVDTGDMSKATMHEIRTIEK